MIVPISYTSLDAVYGLEQNILYTIKASSKNPEVFYLSY